MINSVNIMENKTHLQAANSELIEYETEKEIYMREIKFRAWDTTINRMIDLRKITPLIINIEIDGLFIPFDNRWEIMMYTGLKDCKGKEIYEGDVVKVLRCDSIPQYTAEVYFAGGAFCTYCDHPIVNKAEAIFNWPMEVIGNIYENSELLEEKEI